MKQMLWKTWEAIDAVTNTIYKTDESEQWVTGASNMSEVMSTCDVKLNV